MVKVPDNLVHMHGRGKGDRSEGRSTEQIPAEETKRAQKEETKRQQELQDWLTEIAKAKINVALEDAALPFIERDAGDDEQLGSFDCTGDFDPIIKVGTDSRLLSEEIKRAAATFRMPEKRLKHLLDTRLREEWDSHPKKIPNEPQGEPYGRSYLVNRHGVWLRQTVADLDDLYVWRRIVKTQIDPDALSYDTTPQRNWKTRFLVTVTGETGQFPVDIPAEHLGKDASRAISTLMRHGVHIVESRESRQQLAKFLRYRPNKRIIRASRTGWFEWKGRSVFVLSDNVLGVTEKTHSIMLDPALRSGGYGFRRAGTSEEWRQNVAIPLAGNSNVVLAVGTMLAAPLLRFAEQAGGGFHFYGPAKLGKSLCWAVGQSVWGKPYYPGADASDTFGFDWNSTSGRLVERAVLRSDVGLYLDETHLGDRKVIGSAIYTLAGSLGKGRMGQPEVTFNILIGSTGEKSIVDFLDDVTAGQTVRLTDVPAEVRPGSSFESHDPVAAAEFYSAVSKYYGSVGYDWLQYLVNQTPEKFTPRLKELCKMFLAQPRVAEIAERAHPQVRSVINRFALVAAALAIAVEAEILPWSKADTDEGTIACMQRWLNQRGNRDASGELLREIERRRHEFVVTADDRLIRLADGRLVGASSADQHKLENAEQFDGCIKDGRVLFFPEAWRRLWAGLPVEVVNKHLSDRGLLIVGRDGKISSTERYRAGAPATRFYVLKSTFLDLG